MAVPCAPSSSDGWADLVVRDVRPDGDDLAGELVFGDTMHRGLQQRLSLGDDIAVGEVEHREMATTTTKKQLDVPSTDTAGFEVDDGLAGVRVFPGEGELLQVAVLLEESVGGVRRGCDMLVRGEI